MSKKIIFSTQIFLFILCFSCEQENGSSSDYTKTIDDYEKLIDYAEKDDQDGVIEKLEDLGGEDKFHLQKLARNQKESSTIIKLSELILSKI